MDQKHHRRCTTLVLLSVVLAMLFGNGLLVQGAKPDLGGPEVGQAEGVVKCANLIYGKNKTSVCFSEDFLAQVRKNTYIETHRRLFPVKLESSELYDYPFSVFTGEGSFTLTKPQRENMRNYLVNGGFIVASAGCSSKPWNASFGSEMKKMFPESKMPVLEAIHPVFHTVYDITSFEYKPGKTKLPTLRGLEIDGKIVLIWSSDGLNDTAKAGPNCCCCGGNEIKAAEKVNVNLLAYAVTY